MLRTARRSRRGGSTTSSLLEQEEHLRLKDQQLLMRGNNALVHLSCVREREQWVAGAGDNEHWAADTAVAHAGKVGAEQRRKNPSG